MNQQLKNAIDAARFHISRGIELPGDANLVAGPFFSREEGELVLKQRRHHFTERAVVFCGSAHFTHEYDKAYQNAERAEEQRNRDAWTEENRLRGID